MQLKQSHLTTESYTEYLQWSHWATVSYAEYIYSGVIKQQKVNFYAEFIYSRVIKEQKVTLNTLKVESLNNSKLCWVHLQWSH